MGGLSLRLAGVRLEAGCGVGTVRILVRGGGVGPVSENYGAGMGSVGSGSDNCGGADRATRPNAGVDRTIGSDDGRVATNQLPPERSAFPA